MKLISALFRFTLLVILPFSAVAQSSQQQPTQSVISNGIGKDIESAAKNAAENALTQVVGSFVQADKLIEKRTVINNGIKDETKNINISLKEYSQGTIKSFEVLESSNEGGIFRVTAKVGVRITDFKTFILKLAETEVKIDDGLFAQVSTNKSNSQQGSELVIDKFLMPIIQGEAIEIISGKPIIFSEYENALSNSEKQYYKNSRGKINANTVVVPLEFKINSNFLDNNIKMLDSVSASKKKYDFSGTQSSLLCAEVFRNDSKFNHLTDMRLFIKRSSSITDVYLIKDVQKRERIVSHNDLKVGLTSQGGLSDVKSFFLFFNKMMPFIIIELKNAGGENIKEFMIKRSSDINDTNKSAFFVMDNSSLWSNYLYIRDDCPVIVENRKFPLFLNLGEQELKDTKKINIKMVMP